MAPLKRDWYNAENASACHAGISSAKRRVYKLFVSGILDPLDWKAEQLFSVGFCISKNAFSVSRTRRSVTQRFANTFGHEYISAEYDATKSWETVLHWRCSSHLSNKSRKWVRKQHETTQLGVSEIFLSWIEVESNLNVIVNNRSYSSALQDVNQFELQSLTLTLEFSTTVRFTCGFEMGRGFDWQVTIHLTLKKKKNRSLIQKEITHFVASGTSMVSYVSHVRFSWSGL